MGAFTIISACYLISFFESLFKKNFELGLWHFCFHS